MLTYCEQQVKDRNAVSQSWLEVGGGEDSKQEVLGDFPLLGCNLQLSNPQLRKTGATSVDDRPIQGACSFFRLQVHLGAIVQRDPLPHGREVEQSLQTVAEDANHKVSILGKRKVVEDCVGEAVGEEHQPGARKSISRMRKKISPFIFAFVDGFPELVLHVDGAVELAPLAVGRTFVQNFLTHFHSYLWNVCLVSSLILN